MRFSTSSNGSDNLIECFVDLIEWVNNLIECFVDLIECFDNLIK
jgi:hypothetical protein